MSTVSSTTMLKNNLCTRHCRNRIIDKVTVGSVILFAFFVKWQYRVLTPHRKSMLSPSKNSFRAPDKDCNVVDTCDYLDNENSLTFLFRAYPSLNLTINVSNNLRNIDVVLPGLRYDDVDSNTGQPDIWRMFDMMNRVEAAAFHNHQSFLDYASLYKQNYTTIVKACDIEVKSHFYEVTTPKAPLDISVNLALVGNSTFTTILEMTCGGKMKASIRLKNVHTLIHRQTQAVERLPEWWKNRFDITEDDSKKISPLNIIPVQKPQNTFSHVFAVPLNDTDHTEKTRCASYVRYFLENASIASRRAFYKNIKTNFHEFHTKKMSLLYFAPSCWGDVLVAESWDDDNDPLTLHCQVSKNQQTVWYGKMEMFSEVFGLP